MKKSHNISRLREKLGFSQEAMAAALGVSRSLYSMYESGLRSLSYEASKRMHELELLVQEAPAQSQGSPLLYLHPAEVRELERRLNTLVLRMSSAKRSLAKIRSANQTTLERALHFERVKHLLTASATNELLLHATELNAQRLEQQALNFQSQMKQVELTISIAKMEAEMTAIREALASLAPLSSTTTTA